MQQAPIAGSAAQPSLSLAAYSLHREFIGGKVDAAGMVAAASELGFSALEFVTTFLPAPRRDGTWIRSLNSLRRQADGEGIDLNLVMCEGVGDLGAPRVDRRLRAVDSHCRWVEGAAHLGCSGMRVQLVGDAGCPLATIDRTVKSLQTVLRAASADMALLIENHSRLTADPSWVRSLIRRVASPRLKVLPDTGNFRPGTDVASVVGGLLPHAGGLSAKFFDFDDEGWETTIDYARIVEVVRLNRYDGYIGVEYEGSKMGEREGLRAGKQLLERLFGLN